MQALGSGSRGPAYGPRPSNSEKPLVTFRPWRSGGVRNLSGWGRQTFFRCRVLRELWQLRRHSVAAGAKAGRELEHLRDAHGGTPRAVRLHRSVRDCSTQFLDHGGGEPIRRRLVEVHASPGAVAVQPMAHVEVLLEVMAKWEVDERPPIGGQFHRRRESDLDDRKVTDGEVPIQLMHV